MTLAPRRSLRFGLRTLFIAVMVFACWLGYEMNWIRQRRAVIADPRVQSSTYANTEAQTVTGQVLKGRDYFTAPWPLCWLGEPGYAAVVLDEHASADRVAAVRRLFPEADFVAPNER